MTKRQPILILVVSFFTAIHLVFANFYPRIQAYMNSHDRLLPFIMFSNLGRGLFLFLIVLAGFTCIREKQKFLPIYLGLFLINLVVFFMV